MKSKTSINPQDLWEDLIQEHREDYRRFMIEYSFPQTLMDYVMSKTDDLIPMPPEYPAASKTTLGDSPIEGKGLFCVLPIEQGEFLGPARLNECRTPAGRWVNHGITPNIKFQGVPGSTDLHVYASKDIQPGEELLVDLRQVGSVNGWGWNPDKKEAFTTAIERLKHKECPEVAEEVLESLETIWGIYGYLPTERVRLQRSIICDELLRLI